AAYGEEGMGESVAELVGVHPGDASLGTTPLKGLGNSRTGEPAPFAEPEPGLIGMRVGSTGFVHIPVEFFDSGGRHRQAPLPSALADYKRYFEVPVNIGQPETGDFGETCASVHHHRNQSLVTAIIETGTLA